MEGLNKFVIYLALPAQLFDAMSHAKLGDLAQPGFYWAFSIGMLATAGLHAFLTRTSRVPQTDKIIQSMTSAYSNAGFLGIPLCLIVFGRAGLSPAIITTLFTVSFLFALTILWIELTRLDHGQLGTAMRKVSLALVKNPLLIAPILGIAWSASDLGMPSAIDRYINLLGEAATPCALVAIGLFLAANPIRALDSSVLRIVTLKVAVQPLLTAILVFYVFDMPRMWAQIAILSAALPVGTGPFMIAQIYQRDASASARAILISTMCSVITISILLAWITQTNT
jgi:predicted permease